VSISLTVHLLIDLCYTSCVTKSIKVARHMVSNRSEALLLSSRGASTTTSAVRVQCIQ
jgi:hypothetical protein